MDPLPEEQQSQQAAPMRLFLVVLQVLGTSAIVSSLASYWCLLMPSSHEFSAISSSRDEEMSIGTEEMEVELMQEAMQGSAGFSLWHSKNFARIAKVTMHSKNLNFRYALYFIAKFRYHSEIGCPLILIQTTSFCVIPILSPM